MSAMEPLLRLQGVLLSWHSPHKNERQPAEAFIEAQIQEKPDNFFTGIAQLLSQSTNTTCRNLCVILLRKRLATEDDPPKFCHLQSNSKNAIRKQLLDCAMNDSDNKIRGQIVDCITALAVRTAGFEPWNELLPWTLNLYKRENETDKINALQVLGYLCEQAYHMIEKQVQSILSIYQASLQQGTLKVKIAAIEAVGLTMRSLESKQCEFFAPLIPQILQLLQETIQTDQNKSAKAGAANFDLSIALVEIVGDIARSEPYLFEKELDPYVKAMRMVAYNKHFPDDLRTLSLELLVSLAEGASALCRKSAVFVPACVEVICGCFLIGLEDDEDWNDKPYGANESLEDLVSVGEYSLDRLCRALSGQSMVPVVMQYLSGATPNGSNFWKSTDWRYRHTALMCVTQMSEFMTNEESILQVCDKSLMYFGDANYRVRYAAINAVGQMATDHHGAVPQKLTNKVLPQLLKVLDPKQYYKIQAHAAACVINFAMHCNTTDVDKHLAKLLENLFKLMGTNSKDVQEQVLTAIASLADYSGPKFSRFYDHFAPALLEIIKNATKEDQVELRGRALECMSHIGAAVGAKQFESVASKLVPFTISYFKTANLNGDEFLFKIAMQTWPLICTAIKEKFVPYLEQVAPILLQAAKLDIEAVPIQAKENEIVARQNQTEADLGCEHVEYNASKVDFVYSTQRKVAVNVSKRENKVAAIDVIDALADELGHLFFPALGGFLDTIFELCQFQYSTQVKLHAIHSLNTLINVAVESKNLKSGASDEFVSKICVRTLQVMLETLKQDRDSGVMYGTVGTLVDLVSDESVRPDLIRCLNLDVLNEILISLLHAVQRSQRRITMMTEHAQKQKHVDEIDKSELEQEQDYEDDLLYKLACIIAELIKMFGDKLVPVLDKNMSAILQLLEHEGSAAASFVHKTGVYVVCDIFEQCSPNNLGKYLQLFVPRMLKILQIDQDCPVRQAIFYCFGVMASKCEESFLPFAQSVLSACRNAVQSNEADYMKQELPDFVTAVIDNAQATIAKILTAIPKDKLPPIADQVLFFWFSHLPIQEDIIEAKYCHAILVTLVDRQTPAILGENYANMHLVCKIFAKIVDTKLSNDNLNRAIRTICRKVTSLPPQVRSAVNNHLSEEEKQKLGLSNL